MIGHEERRDQARERDVGLEETNHGTMIMIMIMMNKYFIVSVI